MSKTITIRIDEELKKQLQELMSELGLDITTYFTIAAKQAVREQAIPFKISINEKNNIKEISSNLTQIKNENIYKKTVSTISNDFENDFSDDFEDDFKDDFSDDFEDDFKDNCNDDL